MKIIAKDKEEFLEIIRTSEYLHDFVVEIKRIEWKFWKWISFDDEGIEINLYRSNFVSLDLWGYPILNRLAHLYRIQHAGKEGQLEEQEFLEETFFINGI